MIVMHMSGAYKPQEFYKDKHVTEIDCCDVQGTNCYCDDEAKAILRERIAQCEVEDLHFLDSGNYHYLSLFWLEKIKQPFSLVLFDHHPDMQPPSFGEITSCGGWVKEALDHLPFLQNVYMVGVRLELLEELGLEGKSAENAYNGRVHIGLEDLKKDENPIYISLDKDALGEEDARCDWDQGELSLQQVLSMMKDSMKTHALLGMDVCGEDSKWEQAVDMESIIAINNRANEEIMNFYKNSF